MTKPQQSNDLMNLYAKEYEKSTGSKLRLNRNTAKWAARDIIDSFGYDECINAVNWYFSVKDSGYDWNWFVNNTEKLLEARQDYNDDLEFRKQMRQKAKEWLSE